MTAPARPRRAGPADAVELVRLRSIMLTELTGRVAGPGPWQDGAIGTLRGWLSDVDSAAAAFVVDGELPGRLAAAALGVIEQRLASPDNPNGATGYVFNVVTDPRYRRRGYSRACLAALLDWYRSRGVRRIDLHASANGLPLYRDLGFAVHTEPTMRWTAPSGPTGAG